MKLILISFLTVVFVVLAAGMQVSQVVSMNQEGEEKTKVCVFGRSCERLLVDSRSSQYKVVMYRTYNPFSDFISNFGTDIKRETGKYILFCYENKTMKSSERFGYYCGNRRTPKEYIYDEKSEDFVN